MGVKLPNQPPLTEDFYTYVCNYGSIANGVTGSPTKVQAEQNSWFVLYKMTFLATIATAAQTLSSIVIPLVSIAIQDTGSSWQWMNSAVDIPAIFGTAEFPFILPNPRVWAPNSAIVITCANFSAATTYDRIDLHFIGKRITYA